MADIINLNRARKQKKRDQKTLTAKENRLKYGKTKAEDRIVSLTNKRQSDHLDGHKLSSDDDS